LTQAEARVANEPPAAGAVLAPEVSIVMPCLNEADTLQVCIEKASRALREAGIDGEIVVADNGSTDGSKQIALEHGARVIEVPERGYGSALMRGIEHSRGRYVVMGDADDSYDFAEVPRFVERLRQGFDLVQGCRLPSGGGAILEGAMPPSHRWIGNPLFSALGRWWFNAPVHDMYCGMRGFTRELYDRLGQRCTGMEFATEMIIKSSLRGERIAEIPITLHPDGRRAHPPHLKTFRDGWRTLRFFMLCSPRWLFLVPGMLLILLGLAGYVVALPGLTVFGVNPDVHSLLFASVAILCGYQSVLFAVFAKTFAIAEGILPSDPRMTRLYKLVNLERGLLCAGIALAFGVGLLATAALQWKATGFGHLDPLRTMRIVIPGATLTALGFQTVLSSFLVSILGMSRR
jgi:glycosyltransferase involved in cell wall biosynthesis